MQIWGLVVVVAVVVVVVVVVVAVFNPFFIAAKMTPR